MRVAYHPAGIHLPDLDLWLDPKEPVERAWISHAHSDHARGLHRNVLATPETLRLYRLRWPEDGEIAQSLQPLRYGESVQLGPAKLTAIPAGHIVGAAQLLVEQGGERLVYTGDLKLMPPMCGTATEVVRCDRLIIESTFGLPIFHFLTREEARTRIAAFATATLEDGGVPVFLGYPLGRGQEIVEVLANAGIPCAVHGSIARFLPVYEAAGCRFPGWSPYEACDTKGKALVLTPSMRRGLEASGKDFRIAYVSGWAALDNARTRAGAEELIPYSDHAGFSELVTMVRESGASRIDLVHGYTEPLARILQQQGLDACAPAAQISRAADEEGE